MGAILRAAECFERCAIVAVLAMSGDERISGDDWAELLRTEIGLRADIFIAPDGADGEKLREWWKYVERIFRLYSISVARGEQLERAPWELMFAVSGLLGYVAAGKLPDPIAHALTEGRPAIGPEERRDIGYAVAYCLAASDAGLLHNGVTVRVEDPNPIDTVSKAFGIDKTTARKWRRQAAPAFMGLNDISAETVTSLMKEAGEGYRVAGRSRAALVARASKRK